MESEILTVLRDKLREAEKHLNAASSALLVLKNNERGELGSKLFWQMRIDEVKQLRVDVEFTLDKVSDMDDPDPAGIVSVQPWQDDFEEAL
tara:strand:+ start:229 stop:501 length:273 start_codon:yes stop_codon:yes gene_type:complete